MRTRWLMGICAALALAGPPVDAGVIRGRLELPPVAAPSRVRDPYAGRADALSSPRVATHGLAQDAVVYIASLSAAAESGIPAFTESSKLAQQDQSFVPRVIAIPVGSAIDFPNRDPIYHSVFSVSPTKRFDLGRYGRGKSKRVVFTKAGLVNVYCDIHSNMEAFVLVVPNRAFARPDGDGRFAFPALPAGRYTLVVWHPDFGSTRQDVTLPENGDLDLSLRVAP